MTPYTVQHPTPRIRIRHVLAVLSTIAFLMGAAGFFDTAATAACMNKGYSASECHHMLNN